MIYLKFLINRLRLISREVESIFEVFYEFKLRVNHNLMFINICNVISVLIVLIAIAVDLLTSKETSLLLWAAILVFFFGNFQYFKSLEVFTLFKAETKESGKSESFSDSKQIGNQSDFQPKIKRIDIELFKNLKSLFNEKNLMIIKDLDHWPPYPSKYKDFLYEFSRMETPEYQFLNSDLESIRSELKSKVDSYLNESALFCQIEIINGEHCCTRGLTDHDENVYNMRLDKSTELNDSITEIYETFNKLHIKARELIGDDLLPSPEIEAYIG